MLEIDNWSLSLYPSDKFYMADEVLKIFDKENIYSLYLSGEVGNSAYVSIPVKDIKNNVLTSKSDNKYILKNKSPNYLKFENAIKGNIPVLYGWSVSNVKNKPFIRGIYFQHDRFFNIKDTITGYDNNRGTLKLEIFGEVFLVLGAYTEKEKAVVKKDSKLYTMLLEEREINIKNYIDYLSDNPIKEEVSFSKKFTKNKPS